MTNKDKCVKRGGLAGQESLEEVVQLCGRRTAEETQRRMKQGRELLLQEISCEVSLGLIELEPAVIAELGISLWSEAARKYLQ